MKVSILGAGNGGFGLAYHLSTLGHEVLLYENPNFKPCIDEIMACGSITAEAEVDGCQAALSGTAPITKATYDIKEAVEFGEVIMIIVPSFGQIAVFESALPHLRDNHLVISLPGNYAALEFAQIVQDKGIKKRFRFVDTSSIPYACRKTSPTKVFISGLKAGMNFGVFPAEKTDEVLGVISPLFTCEIRKSANVIDAALCNPNLFLHPPTMIFNSGWIQATEGNFKFYFEGYQPCVANFSEAMDKERMELVEKLDAKPMSCLEIMQLCYGPSEHNKMYDYIHNAKHYKFFQAPPSLDNRYITEDLAFLIVPAVNYLCKRTGVDATVLKAMITCTEVLTGKKIEPARHLKMVLREGESVADMNRRLQKWTE